MYGFPGILNLNSINYISVLVVLHVVLPSPFFSDHVVYGCLLSLLLYELGRVSGGDCGMAQEVCVWSLPGVVSIWARRGPQVLRVGTRNATDLALPLGVGTDGGPREGWEGRSQGPGQAGENLGGSQVL